MFLFIIFPVSSKHKMVSGFYFWLFQYYGAKYWSEMVRHAVVYSSKILKFWSDQPLPWSRLKLKMLPLSLHWSSRIFEVKKLLPLKVLGYPQPWKSSIFWKNFGLDLVNPWISSTRNLKLQGYSCPLYYLCIHLYNKALFMFASFSGSALAIFMDGFWN